MASLLNLTPVPDLSRDPCTNRDGSHGQGGTILMIRGRATRYGSDSTLPTVGGDVSFARGQCRQVSACLTTTLEPILVLYEVS
jgi:hypothetical protein